MAKECPQRMWMNYSLFNQIESIVSKGKERFTRFFFYKNILYKNIEAEIPRKFKNILRIILGSDQVGSDNSCKKAQYN